MNRRKAIRNSILVAGAAFVGVGGYEWFRQVRKPDLAGLASQKELLSEIAETIIPATDTPGAKDAQVGELIYKMIMDCADKRTQNNFLYGLHDLVNYCDSKYSKSFLQCSVAERESILLHFEQRDKQRGGIAGKVQHKLFGDPFFKILKDYTVIGYCSSMQGATKGLAYDYIPGPYQSPLPLRPGQRSWATK